MAARLHDVRFDLENMRKRLVGRRRRRLREPRAAQECWRVRQCNRPRAVPGKRSKVIRAYDDTIGAIARADGLLRKRARQPAVLAILIAARGRIPDFDGAKVREIGLGITDALHDSQLMLAPQRQQRFQ